MDGVASPVRVGALTINAPLSCIEAGQIRCTKPGPALEMVRLAMRIIGLPCEFLIPHDHEWGALVNGTWNGLFAQLLNNETDITVPSTAFNVDRSTHFEHIGFEILPLEFSFIFKPYVLQTLATFTWWRALGTASWAIFITIGLLDCVIVSFPGKKLLFGGVAALYTQLLETFLLPQLIVRQAAPFDSIESATSFFRRGELNLISLQSSSLYTMLNDPQLSELKNVLMRKNCLKWAGDLNQLAREFSEDPKGVVFGFEDMCSQYIKQRIDIIRVRLRSSPMKPLFSTTYLRPGIPDKVKSQLREAFHLLNEVGIRSAMELKYLAIPKHLRPSGKLDRLTSLRLSHCGEMIVALGVGLLLNIIPPLVEIVLAKSGPCLAEGHSKSIAEGNLLQPVVIATEIVYVSFADSRL